MYSVTIDLSPNKFALKTGIEYHNEIRLSEREAHTQFNNELM